MSTDQVYDMTYKIAKLLEIRPESWEKKLDGWIGR